jgi:hypothetical protein
MGFLPAMISDAHGSCTDKQRIDKGRTRRTAAAQACGVLSLRAWATARRTRRCAAV